MGKRRRVLVAALVLAVMGGLAWLVFLRPEPEPVYKGKRLSEWLDVNPSANRTNVVATIREVEDMKSAVSHIGTNAIPTLLRMLRARDSVLTLKLVALAEKQHLVKVHYVRAEVRTRRAGIAFSALGAEARGAVPALMKIYEANISPESRKRTVFALGSIGPDARAAVSLLLRVASDTNTTNQDAQELRRMAFFALTEIHAEPELVVPVLIKALSDPAVEVRRHAIISLGQIHAEPELVVPVLIKALSDSYYLTRMNAAIALGEFGPDAKAAVPALFKLLQDRESLVRGGAADGIKQIDPESAALRKAELDAALRP